MNDLWQTKEMWALVGVVTGGMLTGLTAFSVALVNVREKERRAREQWMRDYLMVAAFEPVRNWLNQALDLATGNTSEDLLKYSLPADVKEALLVLVERFGRKWGERVRIIDTVLSVSRDKNQAPDRGIVNPLEKIQEELVAHMAWQRAHPEAGWPQLIIWRLRARWKFGPAG